MVELIVVMVLIGIIAAVGVPKLMGYNSFTPLALRHQIETALRYAQKTAAGHRRLVCASQSASTTVTFRMASAPGAANCNTALANPIDINVLGSTPVTFSRITFSANVNAILFFQPDGTITSDAAGATPVSGIITITGDGSTYQIRVDGDTGYVDFNPN